MSNSNSPTGADAHPVSAVADTIRAEYGKPGEPAYRQVILDPSAGTITFIGCHQRSRLLASGPEPEYSCKLEEIRGTCETWVRPRHVGPVLEVVTPTGRARLPHAMHGFSDVRRFIEQALAKSENHLSWFELAASREALVLVWGGIGAALAIWAVTIAPFWIGAAVVGAVLIIPLAVCAAYWSTGSTYW